MTTAAHSIALHHLQWLLADIELQRADGPKRIGATADGAGVTVEAYPPNRRITLTVGDEDALHIDLTEPPSTVAERTWDWLNRLTGLERDGALEPRDLG